MPRTPGFTLLPDPAGPARHEDALLAAAESGTEAFGRQLAAVPEPAAVELVSGWVYLACISGRRAVDILPAPAGPALLARLDELILGVRRSTVITDELDLLAGLCHPTLDLHTAADRWVHQRRPLGELADVLAHLAAAAASSYAEAGGRDRLRGYATRHHNTPAAEHNNRVDLDIVTFTALAVAAGHGARAEAGVRAIAAYEPQWTYVLLGACLDLATEVLDIPYAPAPGDEPDPEHFAAAAEYMTARRLGQSETEATIRPLTILARLAAPEQAALTCAVATAIAAGIRAHGEMIARMHPADFYTNLLDGLL